MSISPNRDNNSPITHVYLAGPYLTRDTVKEFAEDVWKAGFVVTSRWHDGPKNDPAKRDAVLDDRVSMQNWHDLSGSDVVVAFADAAARGTLAEIGAAINAGKLIILIGKKHDVTLMVNRPGQTFWADTSEQALEFLQAAEEDADDEDDEDDDE